MSFCFSVRRSEYTAFQNRFLKYIYFDSSKYNFNQTNKYFSHRRTDKNPYRHDRRAIKILIGTTVVRLATSYKKLIPCHLREKRTGKNQDIVDKTVQHHMFISLTQHPDFIPFYKNRYTRNCQTATTYGMLVYFFFGCSNPVKNWRKNEVQLNTVLHGSIELPKSTELPQSTY